MNFLRHLTDLFCYFDAYRCDFDEVTPDSLSSGIYINPEDILSIDEWVADKGDGIQDCFELKMKNNEVFTIFESQDVLSSEINRVMMMRRGIKIEE